MYKIKIDSENMQKMIDWGYTFKMLSPPKLKDNVMTFEAEMIAPNGTAVQYKPNTVHAKLNGIIEDANV